MHLLFNAGSVKFDRIHGEPLAFSPNSISVGVPKLQGVHGGVMVVFRIFWFGVLYIVIDANACANAERNGSALYAARAAGVVILHQTNRCHI